MGDSDGRLTLSLCLRHEANVLTTAKNATNLILSKTDPLTFGEMTSFFLETDATFEQSVRSQPSFFIRHQDSRFYLTREGDLMFTLRQKSCSEGCK
jgi:hypothetical protein